MEVENTIKTHVFHCGSKDAARWDEYLENQSSSNFYLRYGWKTVNELNFNHHCYYLAIEQDTHLVGVFPLVFIKSRLFGRILCSMPFVNFGGLIADSEKVTQLLLKEAESLAKDCNADYLELRSLHAISSDMPTSQHKISMTLDLNADPDVLWNNFKSKHRTNIRRVYKEGIYVKHGRDELLDDFYTLMAKSWKWLGTPIYKKSYFKNILDTFPDDTLIFIAYQGKEPLAAAFNGYYKKTVEGMWAGAIPEYRKYQPNYVLYWEMMKHACEAGFEEYHLGRSTADSGAEAFKKKWNAYAKQLHWHYILNNQDSIPQLNVNNPKFDMAIKIWKKLPLRITTIIGPIIARSIP